MRGNVVIAALGLLDITAFLVQCASTTAPSDWLPDASEAQSQAYGAWIRAQHKAGSTEALVRGEFITADDESVFVLTEDSLVSIPLGYIEHASLTTFNSHYAELAWWTVLGTLSTLSHGVGLIISAPTWMVVGTVATSAQSYTARKGYPLDSWIELRKYARFPGGLPKGLDRKRLKPKPY